MSLLARLRPKSDVNKLLSKLDVSPFGSAFLYSMNYALGFIIIYLLGYTLATK